MTSAEPSKLHSSWGSAPDPGIYRIDANLGERGGGAWPPALRSWPLLAALGLRPRRALSSAQVACNLAQKQRSHTKNDSPAVVRSELLAAAQDPSPLSQLEADLGCGGFKPKASQHDALNGVAHWARNSQQINQRLPPPGRASRAQRERRLAKEWFGSNRALKRTIATSRSDDDQNESNPATSLKRSTINENRRSRQALPLRKLPDGNRTRLTNSFRKGPAALAVNMAGRPATVEKVGAAFYYPLIKLPKPVFRLINKWKEFCISLGPPMNKRAY